MRILHCIPSLGDGGAERQLSYLAPALVARGCEVHVVLLQEGANAERFSGGAVVLHRLKRGGNHDPRLVTDLRRVIRQVRPHVVQSWLPQMDVLAGMAVFMDQIPWIVSERACAEAYNGSWKLTLRRWLARRATAIVANSAGGAAYWRSAIGRRTPIHVIPNAVPTGEIADVRPASAIDGPFVLSIGRLTEQKNMQVIISAFSRVASRTEAKLILCGEGHLRSQLEQQIADLGLRQGVTLPGVVRPVMSLLKAAALFVSSSIFEGHPNSVIEAIACGCPLVVSDIPAHREFLDEQTARFCRPSDSAAFAEAIVETLADSAAAGRRADTAKKILDRLTPDGIAARFHDVYRSVVAVP